MQKIIETKGVAIIATLLLISLLVTPVAIENTRGDSPNYTLVYQGDNPYKIAIDHSKVKARAYLWEGTGGASSYRIAYTKLYRVTGWETEKFKQQTGIDEGSPDTTDDNNGAYSPYPLDDGDGYGSYEPHNSIASHSGSYVDVPTDWRTADWDVSSISWAVDHYWNDGETSSYDDACIGSAFYAGSGNDYCYILMKDWDISDGSWPFEQHKDVADNDYTYLYE